MSDSAFGEAGIMGCEQTHPELETWADFVREFALNASPSWVFRGHGRHDWQLVTTLNRAFDEAGIEDAKDRTVAENSTIGLFQERARLHLDHPPDEHDLLGWLAVMQHYGAPTRLQDWTQSPFVAAYFAYRAASGEDACIWALQAFLCRRALTPVMVGMPWDHLGVMSVEGEDEHGEPLVMYPWTELRRVEVENETLREAIRGGNGWPLPILPLGYDARMAAQQAVFVCATQIAFPLDALLDKGEWPKPTKPERFVEQMTKQQAEYPLEQPFQVLKKIHLRAAWRDDALRTLRQMGIAEETMFPSLDGVGRAARMYLGKGDAPLQDALHSLGI